jgi:hypothetical protein
MLTVLVSSCQPHQPVKASTDPAESNGGVRRQQERSVHSQLYISQLILNDSNHCSPCLSSSGNKAKMSSITQLKGLVQRLLTLPLNLGAYILRLFGFLSITPPQVARRSRPQNEKCRFRLDNDSSDTLTLPDGRKLGYAQYGSLKGKSVFYLHGLPGSRIEGTWFHDLGLKLGARIIAADRPGYGWSSPHPGRTLLDFTKDLESLAKHLGIEKYAVLVRTPITTFGSYAGLLDH